jgi:hypothetical protein
MGFEGRNDELVLTGLDLVKTASWRARGRAVFPRSTNSSGVSRFRPNLTFAIFFLVGGGEDVSSYNTPSLMVKMTDYRPHFRK